MAGGPAGGAGLQILVVLVISYLSPVQTLTHTDPSFVSIKPATKSVILKCRVESYSQMLLIEVEVQYV